MKMNKDIKEIVKKRLTEGVYAKYPELEEMHQKREANEKAYQEKLKELEKTLDAHYIAELKKAGFDINENGENFVYIRCYNSGLDTKLKDDIYNLTRSIDKEIAQKMDDLIIDLSLGENKKDFDRLIAEAIAK